MVQKWNLVLRRLEMLWHTYILYGYSKKTMFIRGTTSSFSNKAEKMISKHVFILLNR